MSGEELADFAVVGSRARERVLLNAAAGEPDVDAETGDRTNSRRDEREPDKAEEGAPTDAWPRQRMPEEGSVEQVEIIGLGAQGTRN